MNFLPVDMVENFHFLRPLYLYAMIPVVLLTLLLKLAQTRQNSWVRAIDPRLLPYLLDKHASPAQSLPLYGLLLLWVLSTLALAGPVWQEVPVPVQQREDAVVIVLDMSMSMYATDLAPNRATRAQRKTMDILDFRSEEGQTGLVAYAGDAHAVTPMTDDVETIRNLVPSLQPNVMPILGSDPAAGVTLALQLLANSGLTQARLLLLTDGIVQSDIAAVGSLLAGSGHNLSVIGFGTEAGSPVPMGQQGYLRDDNNAIVIPRLERLPLQQLAEANGGLYTDAQLTDADVVALLEQEFLPTDENLTEVADRQFDAWYETGPWLLLLLLPVAALAFRRGWLLVLAIGVLVLPAEPGYAWEWQDLWQRPDQQGSAAFRTEDYAAAAARFKDPAWRAAAAYRNQDYQATVSDLSTLDDPESNYNRGNALAHLGQFAAAIEAYDRTLAVVADHTDALHNKEIVQKLLEEQQKEQEQQEQQSGDQEQQQQQQEQNQQQDQQQQNQNQQQQQQDQQQQQQQNQDQQQSEQDQQQQQQEEEKQDENEEQEEQDQQEQEPADQRPNEEEQAMQQWLMRIPDDPGELLRNKFRYQAQQQQFEQLQNPTPPPAKKQTW